MKIAKEFRWEMGHRLPDHDGECRNVHGHSYRMRVEVEGRVDPATGMVIDFGLISRHVKPLVAELDHAFLCQASDTGLRDFLRAMGVKLVVIPVPSTVENICQLFVDRLAPWLRGLPHVNAFTIRIWETANSQAEIRMALCESKI